MKISRYVLVRRVRSIIHTNTKSVQISVIVSLLFVSLYLMLMPIKSVVIFLSDDSSRSYQQTAAALVEPSQTSLRTDLNLTLADQGYERMIQEDEARIVPGLGENGEPVVLKGEEAERGEADLKEVGYNRELSKKIALNRTLPQVNHPSCEKIQYREDLPSASVIIVFFDESLSTLLRTIHSVINRSPPQYLNEIILVDDCSTFDELKGKLDYYIRTRLPKYVKLFRLKSRSGLVRARLKGAELAQSEIMVFMDAHCEATNGWLTPLLARVREDRKNVVVPIIDHINLKTFNYDSDGYEFSIGTFSWYGLWLPINIPPEEREREPDLTKPMKTPVMAGGLFAIDRNYFYEIGSYDEKMELWGGENLEISFRIWQCGGNLEVVPCSRVGHVFPSKHAWENTNDTGDFGVNNIARMARVWWDDYIRLLFLRLPHLENADIGDLTDRIELKERLNCRPFSWYLQEIDTRKFVRDENVRAYGHVEGNNGTCLDFIDGDEVLQIGFYPCNNFFTTSQDWSLTKTDELRGEFYCLGVDSEAAVSLGASFVTITLCVGADDQKWKYTEEGLLRHVKSGLCLESEASSSGGWVKAKVKTCEPHKATQMWSWGNLIEKPTTKNPLERNTWGKHNTSYKLPNTLSRY